MRSGRAMVFGNDRVAVGSGEAVALPVVEGLSERRGEVGEVARHLRMIQEGCEDGRAP